MRESDPRVVRTKERIKQCFFELMKKKPFEEISVKELCDAAQCSRNTFYMHFEYKDNLYKQIVDECIADILQGFSPLTSRLSEQTEEIIEQYTENLMSRFSRNAETLRVLFASDHSGYFRAKLLAEIIRVSVSSSSQASGLNADTKEWRLVLHYSMGGIIEFISYWLQTPEISPARAKTILRDLTSSTYHIAGKYLSSRNG